MSNTKTVIRFFTIADYEEEEAWLRSRHNSGWKLAKLLSPAFMYLKAANLKTLCTDLIIKTTRKTENICVCSKITAGNVLTAVWAGFISANPYPKPTASRTRKFSPTTSPASI